MFFFCDLRSGNETFVGVSGFRVSGHGVKKRGRLALLGHAVVLVGATDSLKSVFLNYRARQVSRGCRLPQARRTFQQSPNRPPKHSTGFPRADSRGRLALLGHAVVLVGATDSLKSVFLNYRARQVSRGCRLPQARRTFQQSPNRPPKHSTGFPRADSRGKPQLGSPK